MSLRKDLRRLAEDLDDNDVETLLQVGIALSRAEPFVVAFDGRFVAGVDGPGIGQVAAEIVGGLRDKTEPTRQLADGATVQ